MASKSGSVEGLEFLIRQWVYFNKYLPGFLPKAYRAEAAALDYAIL